LLNDFKNTFYKFGTLLHCFNDCLLDYHIVRAQNVPPLWIVRRREGALSQLRYVEGRAKCPTLSQLCGLVIGTRVAGQGSK